jgi:hypothetical protein
MTRILQLQEQIWGMPPWFANVEAAELRLYLTSPLFPSLHTPYKRCCCRLDRTGTPVPSLFFVNTLYACSSRHSRPPFK